MMTSRIFKSITSHRNKLLQARPLPELPLSPLPLQLVLPLKNPLYRARLPTRMFRATPMSQVPALLMMLKQLLLQLLPTLITLKPTRPLLIPLTIALTRRLRILLILGTKALTSRLRILLILGTKALTSRLRILLIVQVPTITKWFKKGLPVGITSRMCATCKLMPL